MVRAKFRCETKTETVHGFKVELKPVISGSQENEDFYRYTPGGEITLYTINENAASQFIIGKEYYIDFTPAE